MRRLELLIAASVVIGTGCDGAAQRDCPPPGVVGPHDGSSVLVCARDAVTGAPLAGVRVEEWNGDVAAASGVTDADGRFALPAGAIGADHEVAVSAPGYVSLSFVGFDASAMTLPLAPVAPSLASLAVTVSGLDALPTTGATSLEVDVAASAPRSMADLPADATAIDRRPACMLSLPAAASCVATVPVAAGMRSLVATVLAVDDRATPDPADDVRTVIGFGLLRGLDATISHAAIVARPVSSPPLDVRLTGTPSALADVVGVPGLAASTDGVAFLPHVATPADGRLAVPLDDPMRGDATFWVLGVATTPGARSGSLVVRRGIADATSPVSLSTWLSLPTLAGSDVGLAPGATLHVVDELATDGTTQRRRIYAGATVHVSRATSADLRVTAIAGPGSSTALDLAALDREATQVSFARN